MICFHRSTGAVLMDVNLSITAEFPLQSSPDFVGIRTMESKGIFRKSQTPHITGSGSASKDSNLTMECPRFSYQVL